MYDADLDYDDSDDDEGDDFAPSGVAVKSANDLVEAASSKDIDEDTRAARIAEAESFFLDDKNDISQRPPEDTVDIMRINEDGDEVVALTVRIRALSDDNELKQIRRRSREKGRGGVRSSDSETDDVRFYTLLCAECIVKPDLQSPAMISKFRTPEKALQKRLLIGERISLGDYILAYSGFGNSATKASKTSEIEAAKN